MGAPVVQTSNKMSDACNINKLKQNFKLYNFKLCNFKLHKKFVLCSGANVIKVFTAVSYNFS
jgi:hypothetical protein